MRRKKNLSIVWIDYQQAFDSIPHSWVRVNSKIVRFCKSSVENWNTVLQLKTKHAVLQSQPIQVQKEIFQVTFSQHCCPV